MMETIKGIRTAEGVAQIDYDALSNKPVIVNPNLLDNWYFGNPVNQRGFTTGPGYSSTEPYCIDRWLRTGYSAATITVDNGIVIDNASVTNGSSQIYQKLENVLPNATYIASVLVAEVSGTGTLSIADSGGNLLSGVTISTPGLHFVSYNGDKAARLFMGSRAKSKVKFTAVKLELGDVQTLAHQDANGNWVLNEIPNYADQLARCQRYQLRIGYNFGSTYSVPIGVGIGYSETSIRVFVPTPVMMRTSPVISYFGNGSIANIKAYGNGGTVEITDIRSLMNNNTIQLIATASNVVAGEIYSLVPNVSAGIMLDANL